MPISLTPWLTPEERFEVNEKLIGFELIEWSNDRDLKLKSGGLTDIFIKLREVRNKAKYASNYVAWVFANPLFRLNPDRFVEVPDAVTPFSSRIAELIGKPYFTIRREEKEGRVADAKISGECFPRDRVAIYDDVITDGQSKVGPYKECIARDTIIEPLVVMVDRQQGWKENFIRQGINMNVWPGQTLHDIRRHLVENGYMERCDPLLEEKNPVIFAADGKNWEELLPTLDQLRDTGTIIKVNDLLVAKGTESLLPDLSVYGRVMADLKCFDIDNTVKNIIKHLLPCPPWAVTVHASATKEVVQAAVKTLKKVPTKVLAVTLLTSFDEDRCEEVYVRQPWEQVLALARIAKRGGADGFVCSAEEASELKRLYPEMLVVTPAIRSAGVDSHEQARVKTPRGAMEAGADYLVMGRQIYESPDPVAEISRIQKEELRGIM
ncbi:MAG: orotidine-5'-phosphate decarboxylase [Candidatus Moranbacteria bacterium]|nr:orotidine-5'-phosphate decarboxylase [Candidatus Moranbacteria bacterium]